MTNKPHILFLNGRVPPPLNVGGDGVSIDTFLKILKKRNYVVDCHGVINPYFQLGTLNLVLKQLRDKKISFNLDERSQSVSYDNGYPVTVHAKINLLDFLKEYKNKYPNLVILTQLDLARDILDICIQMNIPLVVFVRDAQANNFLTMEKIKRKEERVHIAFNSEYTFEKFHDVRRFVSTSIIYPPLIANKFKCDSHNPKYITMINPVGVKGGHIFYEIAKHLPNEQFLAVKGWYDPIKDGLDFTKLRNVTVWEKQEDVKKVYTVTRLLLVPSQWEEGFGRVAAEGLIAGIPVLASKNAGLTSALGCIGFYVDDHTNAASWVEKINVVLSMDESSIHDHVKEGASYASKFDSELLTNKLEQAIQEIL